MQFSFSSGAIDQPVYLDSIQCSKSDTRLSKCWGTSLGYSNCRHDQDIAIVCVPHTTPTPVPGECKYTVYVKLILADNLLNIAQISSSEW